MCQLKVRLILADNREERVDDVAAIDVGPDKITLSSLFEPPRELYGFQIKEIDCLRNSVLLEWRAA
ncbi:CooT family nickel-binding protein [Sodalis sp. dw_96]|uniref:CooT family nickel-binding protein n=1 Tax=Sodalis sp. dw_96 TaxID=2719794 RepID=UPI001BD6C6CA|nr:CooT family nickel-binding protein [Sodalis sp. dw_96]